MNKSANKIVLITGTSSGIGESTAIAFAKKGYHVIATMRDLTKSNALKHRAKQEGVEIEFKQLDVCKDESVNNCIKSVFESHGHIDILINNAGTGYRGTLEQTSLEDMMNIMDINYFSVVRMTKAVLPSMRQRRSGHIITVSSVGGLIGVPFNDAYCAAKFAIEGLMESMAPVVATFGIHTSLIEPGPVNTSFLTNIKGKELGHSSESNPYSELECAYVQSLPERYKTTSQSADDIAEVIVKAATSNQPQFRYQTSSAATQFAGRKYIDTTGNSIIQATGQMIKPGQQVDLLAEK